MLRAGAAPDAFTYNALISSFARAGLWRKALAYLADMRRDGLSPDRLTYNALIAACASAGEVRLGAGWRTFPLACFAPRSRLPPLCTCTSGVSD